MLLIAAVASVPATGSWRLRRLQLPDTPEKDYFYWAAANGANTATYHLGSPGSVSFAGKTKIFVDWVNAGGSTAVQYDLYLDGVTLTQSFVINNYLDNGQVDPLSSGAWSGYRLLGEFTLTANSKLVASRSTVGSFIIGNARLVQSPQIVASPGILITLQ